MIKETDSLIFDLDGTLWDSTERVAKAWQAAIEGVGYVKEPLTAADVASIAGLPYDVIYQQLFPYLEDAQHQELKKICAREELKQIKEYGGKLYENLEDTLGYLKGKYRLFIVSNCQSGYIEAFLEHHRLQAFFDDMECFGNAERSKAENILEIIRRNNLQSPVYIGDTQGDLEASRKSGLPFIYARYGFGQPREYDKSIERISELKELF